MFENKVNFYTHLSVMHSDVVYWDYDLIEIAPGIFVPDAAAGTSASGCN